MLAVSMAAHAALPLIYNGETLPENTDFRRVQYGTLITKKTMAEISGIACSRVTPGYLWMESDNISNQIIATNQGGDRCYLKLRLSLSAGARWDWEDLCGGVYDGKNYLFVAAIGDNNENGGEYRIHYLEEPEIPTTKIDSTRKTKAKSILFQYPDGKLNNAEALMYDNVEQMFYIITKKYYQPCQVFSLPMRLDYGNEVQTLTYVCDLGVQSDLGGAKHDYGFHLVTGADISPDGKYILIKNHNNTTVDRKEYGYSWTLLWTRDGDESISETLKRQPQVIGCYEEEWQGEAICWKDSTIFFTTSDDTGNPPIYLYMNQYAPLDSGVESVRSGENKSSHTLVFVGNTLYIRGREGLYTMDGQLVK